MTERDGDAPSVIEAFRAGQEWSLAEIYARWSPLVYSFAVRSLGSVREAEVVTQQVFTQAWTTRRTFDPAGPGLSSWLLEITRSRVTRAPAADLDPPTDAMRPTTVTGNEIDPAELAERLTLADELSRLDAVPRQVLGMALYDEVPHIQIAERMELPPGTVKSYIRRGLRTLRERLEVQTDAC